MPNPSQQQPNYQTQGTGLGNPQQWGQQGAWPPSNSVGGPSQGGQTAGGNYGTNPYAQGGPPQYGGQQWQPPPRQGGQQRPGWGGQQGRGGQGAPGPQMKKPPDQSQKPPDFSKGMTVSNKAGSQKTLPYAGSGQGQIQQPGSNTGGWWAGQGYAAPPAQQGQNPYPWQGWNQIGQYQGPQTYGQPWWGGQQQGGQKPPWWGQQQPGGGQQPPPQQPPQPPPGPAPGQPGSNLPGPDGLTAGQKMMQNLPGAQNVQRAGGWMDAFSKKYGTGQRGPGDMSALYGTKATDAQVGQALDAIMAKYGNNPTAAFTQSHDAPLTYAAQMFQKGQMDPSKWDWKGLDPGTDYAWTKPKTAGNAPGAPPVVTPGNRPFPGTQPGPGNVGGVPPLPEPDEAILPQGPGTVATKPPDEVAPPVTVPQQPVIPDPEIPEDERPRHGPRDRQEF